MTALVFGAADPKDYMYPVCECGHMKVEHYDPEGGQPPDDATIDDAAFCWSGWIGNDDGCDCLVWRRKP